MTQSIFAQHRRATSVTLICVALACLIAVVIGLGSCLFNVGSANSSASYKNAVYIYLCGSTLETKNSIASKNITEMLESNISNDTAVIIETGGTRKWRGHDIPENSLVRYRVQNGQLVELSREDDANMGEANTLTSFLNFCNENYKAENTTLVFWNHGAGSVKGVCLDENHGLDGLTPTEINQAFDKVDAHFNTVCFDACLMANYETARVVSEHANTMIASQELEPAAGWNYKTLVESAGSKGFASNLLSAYKTRCEEKGKRLWTLSAIDLTKFAHVESAFDSFCTDVLSKRAEENNLQAVTNSAIDAMSFGEQNSKSDLIDLSQFADALGYKSLTDAIKSCTQTVNGEDRQGASGVSIFFPLSSTSSLKDYLTGETSDAYKRFLGSNFQKSTTTEAIKFLDTGSVDGTKFTFKIAASSASYVQSVVYDIYQLQGSDPANCLGFDNDIQTNGKGEFSIAFSGRWVALNGCLLSCEPIDSVGDVTVFSAPVTLNNNEGDLRFTFNSKTNDYTLQGFVAIEEDGTQGRLEDVKQGDKITILAEKFKDGETLDTEFKETSTITVGDDLELSSATLPDGRYQIYGIITDLYGNEYITHDFVVRLEGGEVIEAKAF